MRGEPAPLASRGWRDADVPPLDGRRYFITGGNTGLGYATARVLARRGAHVILACRDLARGVGARERLLRELPGARVDTTHLELANLASVRRTAQTFVSVLDRLDGLVCNAGVMGLPHRRTADGFEYQIGVNHLGHFALVGVMLPLLLRTPGARVVVVSSQLHRRGRLELLDDPNFERHPYDRWQAYNQSKLANLLFTFELDRRLRDAGAAVLAVAAHPGYAATELQIRAARARGSRLEALAMAILNALFAQSAAAGAWPILRAATDPAARGGDYFGPSGWRGWRGPAVRVAPAPAARDPDAAARLWRWSETATGVRYPLAPTLSTREIA
jgi:NAD(P)-dependent dehydrogenase (short-subunit alcohol dehydrogenase family)